MVFSEYYRIFQLPLLFIKALRIRYLLLVPGILIILLSQRCRSGVRRLGATTVQYYWYLSNSRLHFFFFFFFLNLTYSRWASSLPSCLWSQMIFPSLPGSRLTIFYRDASSALLQLVNQWWNFTYSRSHAFRYERKNTNPTLVRIELTTSALAGVQVTY